MHFDLIGSGLIDEERLEEYMYSNLIGSYISIIIDLLIYIL